MMLCPHCATSNPPDSHFCQQCGRPIDRPADATVAFSAGAERPAAVTVVGPREKDLQVSQLFAEKARLVVGRAPDCDLHLPHPSVSRYHARLERKGDQLLLADLGSVNGVWLNGRRIADETRVRDGDRVGVGPYLLSLSGNVLRQLDNSKSLRLEARHLEKVVRLPRGGTRKILDDVNLVVNPGEFVTLLGPSGCGKSTLMDALNGRRPATGGTVLANGEDFYKHFDSFRQSLGYVPQKDIVHAGLTVYRALYYTAQLRLPLDTSPEELRARVDAVMREMELTPHKDTLVADLSGGQIKRVSLGAELIAEPSMLYIDEATSGLDAGTEARMMRLFRRLADEGRAVVCITHNVDNVDQCHLVLVLARGKLTYYGPPGEAPRYFGVKRISDVYDRLAEKDPAEWEKAFRATALYRKYVADRLMARPTVLRPAAAPPTEPLPQGGSALQPPEPRSPLAAVSDLVGASRLLEVFPPLADRFRDLEASVLRWRDRLGAVREWWHQFLTLTLRYLELIWGDRRSLGLLLLQAPLVAAFLLLGFVNQNYRQPMPILRPLTAKERDALVVVRALHRNQQHVDAPDPDRKPPPDVKVTVAGVENDAARLLAYRATRQEVLPAEAALLERTVITVDAEDGDAVTMKGGEMLRQWQGLQGSSAIDQLIASTGSVVPDRPGINPRFTYVLLFVLVMIVLWFGCNNAAKEIVKEEAIYARERAVNLHVMPYLASKFVVLTAVTVFHALALLGIVYGSLEFMAWLRHNPGNVPPPSQMLGYGWQVLVVSLLSMTGVALGLLLSACVSSPDRANALLPYVLIPQLILGGGLVPVRHGAMHWLAMALSPIYWAYSGVRRGAHEFAEDFPLYYPLDEFALPRACVALAVQTLLLLAATAWFLKRKDA